MLAFFGCFLSNVGWFVYECAGVHCVTCFYMDGLVVIFDCRYVVETWSFQSALSGVRREMGRIPGIIRFTSRNALVDMVISMLSLC